MTQAAVMRESVGWDTSNWTRALGFWERHTAVRARGSYALEVGVGGTHGNLSLWLAHKGFRVVCSGLEKPSDAIRRRHVEYGVADAVEYESIDVLDMTCAGTFDVVAFKSVLGSFGGSDADALGLASAAVRNMWRVLRPGGELWFAEGVRATLLHELLRSRFGSGRQGWRYADLSELREFLAPFGEFDIATYGFLALGGRSEAQRRTLGWVDRHVCERMVAPRYRYVAAGVARKDSYLPGSPAVDPESPPGR